MKTQNIEGAKWSYSPPPHAVVLSIACIAGVTAGCVLTKTGADLATRCVVAILLGIAVGLAAIAGMGSISLLKGRNLTAPSMVANAILAFAFAVLVPVALSQAPAVVGFLAAPGTGVGGVSTQLGSLEPSERLSALGACFGWFGENLLILFCFAIGAFGFGHQVDKRRRNFEWLMSNLSNVHALRYTACVDEETGDAVIFDRLRDDPEARPLRRDWDDGFISYGAQNVPETAFVKKGDLNGRIEKLAGKGYKVEVVSKS